MPFRLTVLAAALLGSALPALAQSSVQISGILDLAVRQVSNEGPGSARSMVSGSNSTSRIALTGREDLGNGLSASFHLEHGLLADTGAPAAANKFWDRRSTVSLTSSSLGELRLGRDFVPSYTVWPRHDPFAYVGVARSANLVSATPVGPIRSAFGSNANTTVRADNALQWIAPAGLGGFEAGVLLAPSEGGAVANGLARIVSARVGYTTASWAVAAATTRSRNTQTTAGDFKDDVIGGQVNLGAVRVFAAWRQFGYDQTRQRLTTLAASTTQGPHEFKASWVRADMAGRVGTASVDANDADQLGLGYVYNLSKRSALYASLAVISNDSQARFVIPDGPAGIVAGGRSRGMEAGIRHRF